MNPVRVSAATLRRLAKEGRIPASEIVPMLRSEKRVTAEWPRREDFPATLMEQCRALPIPEREYRFAHPRRWRFDLAWPDFRVACEIDGGGFMVAEDGQGGRHSRGEGIERDCEKLSEAAARGWRVLRVTPRQVEDGRAVQWVTRALLDGPPWA